jgi:hypothetical protein
MGFSLRVNHKTLESGNKNPPPRRVRNRQFKYISQKRDEFTSRESPIVSIDTNYARFRIMQGFLYHGWFTLSFPLTVVLSADLYPA